MTQIDPISVENLYLLVGSDACVCITVALLLACFSTEFSDKNCPSKFSNAYKTGTITDLPTKQGVKQHLGLVTSWYSKGRPTRGMLKQVYNFFIEENQKQLS